MPRFGVCMVAGYAVTALTLLASLAVYAGEGRSCAEPCRQRLAREFCSDEARADPDATFCRCEGAIVCFLSFAGIWWPERGIFIGGLTLAAILYSTGLPRLHGAYAKATCSPDGAPRCALVCWLHVNGFGCAVCLIALSIFEIQSLWLHIAFATAFFVLGFSWHVSLTFLHPIMWADNLTPWPRRRGLCKVAVVLVLMASCIVTGLLAVFGDDVFVSVVLPVHEWVTVVVLFVGFVQHGVDLLVLEQAGAAGSLQDKATAGRPKDLASGTCPPNAAGLSNITGHAQV